MSRLASMVAIASWGASLALGCGGGEAGFRIDQVSLAPDDIPMNSPSTAEIRISASVFNDRQEVLEVLVRSDDASIWLDLEPQRYPKWSGAVPVLSFFGYPIGDYRLDIEARDAANRTARLEDAVRLRIRDE